MNKLDLSDPFSTKEENLKVHLRVQQRNARQRLTTVSGLSQDLDFKDLAKKIKKRLCCSGAVVHDESDHQVLQLTGDQRQEIVDFLVETGIVDKKDIIVHGY